MLVCCGGGGGGVGARKNPNVLMSNTPPYVVLERLRVHRQDARMCSTCGRLPGTHGGVLKLHTEACWTSTQRGLTLFF